MIEKIKKISVTKKKNEPFGQHTKHQNPQAQRGRRKRETTTPSFPAPSFLEKKKIKKGPKSHLKAAAAAV